MWAIVMIGLGGAAGSVLRYLLSLGATRWLGTTLPWGTLAANVIGSFALGVLMELSGERRIAGVQARLVLGTGVLGGFTTYSSFNLETLRLFEQGAVVRGGAYLFATVLVCMLAGFAGIALARALKG
ncbi:MAG: fluoride efflux transporter CrcB [Sandaracinaceae bacterium]|nr:fluoride efflux transporter CrcB [Sandaracinaceae bacterium]